jgi:FKBP-type peptidyl-prolyl cis-trans isomerase FkpA
MKYILFILALAVVAKANAQTDFQHTPEGALYKIYTKNTGARLKLGDVVSFNVTQKTDKDSVLGSSFNTNTPAKDQIKPPKEGRDFVEVNLMELLPLLTIKDSALLRIPADTLIKGHEAQRPPFFPPGSYLNLVVRVEKVQTLDQAIAERDSALAKERLANEAAAAKYKVAEVDNTAKYIASHKLVMTTTATGLKYQVTLPSKKPKPLAGDTVLVNYSGRTLQDKLFDSSIEAVAKAGGLNEPGRTFEPIQVVLGEHRVISGWEEALLLMNEGEKAKFIIPFNLGYGDQASGPDIAPYTTLEFDMELVKVKPIKHPEVAKPAPVKKTIHHKKKPVNNN